MSSKDLLSIIPWTCFPPPVIAPKVESHALREPPALDFWQACGRQLLDRSTFAVTSWYLLGFSDRSRRAGYSSTASISRVGPSPATCKTLENALMGLTIIWVSSFINKSNERSERRALVYSTCNTFRPGLVITHPNCKDARLNKPRAFGLRSSRKWLADPRASL